MADHDGQGRDALAVAKGVAVACFERGRERRHHVRVASANLLHGVAQRQSLHRVKRATAARVLDEQAPADGGDAEQQLKVVEPPAVAPHRREVHRQLSLEHQHAANGDRPVHRQAGAPEPGEIAHGGERRQRQHGDERAVQEELFAHHARRDRGRETQSDVAERHERGRPQPNDRHACPDDHAAQTLGKVDRAGRQERSRQQNCHAGREARHVVRPVRAATATAARVRGRRAVTLRLEPVIAVRDARIRLSCVSRSGLAHTAQQDAGCREPVHREDARKADEGERQQQHADAGKSQCRGRRERRQHHAHQRDGAHDVEVRLRRHRRRVPVRPRKQQQKPRPRERRQQHPQDELWQRATRDQQRAPVVPPPPAAPAFPRVST